LFGKGIIMREKIQDILILVFLLPALCQATPIITDFYEDGTIKNGDVYDIVRVWDSATVDMTGGQVNQLNALESATINFSGGTVLQGISIINNSKFYLNGALNLSSYYLFGINYPAEFYIDNGMFNGRLGTDGHVTISDGSVNIGLLLANNNSITDIYGGIVTFTDDVSLSRDSVLNVYGGEVTFNGNSFGEAFSLSPDAAFNVYYSDIIYDGSGSHIIGYHLLDNSEFMLSQFTQTEISQINFVPEPTTFFLLGLGAILLRKIKLSKPCQ
jgi:hypothetical protein